VIILVAVPVDVTVIPVVTVHIPPQNHPIHIPPHPAPEVGTVREGRDMGLGFRKFS